jgi:ectoine hydroxylase-related dioxygenase (phytanoyl-CoA dioxygenase family)
MADDMRLLSPANDLLDDEAALREKFEEDGLLFLRQVFNGAELAAVGDRFAGLLRAGGFADPLPADGGDGTVRWSGKDVESVDDLAFDREIPHAEFWAAASVQSVLQTCFTGPVHVFKQRVFRFVAPRDKRFITPPHQDGYYVESDDFRTVWVPLVACDARLGGLNVIPGSHRLGLLSHVAYPEYRVFGRDYSPVGIPADLIDGPWLSSPYEPGDMIIFHRHLVHGSLPNLSAHGIRLSMDVRVQPQAAPRSYYATHDAAAVSTEANRKTTAAWVR